MTDEMLVAGEPWLPQYRKAIATAKARLVKGKAIKTRKYAGAARLHTKTEAEMRKDPFFANLNAAAADKAKKRPAAKTGRR
jgi:alpha-galactosidase